MQKEFSISLPEELTFEEKKVFYEIFALKHYGLLFPLYAPAVVVDIGAHFGFFALYASLHLHQEGTVYCVEPSSANFAKLQNIVAANRRRNIFPWQGAITGTNGIANLRLGNSVNNSLLPEYSEIQQFSSEETISTLTLADYCEEQKINNIDFLKMDCEGAEYPALYHSSPAFLKSVKTFSIEFHDIPGASTSGTALAHFFLEHGFHIVSMSLTPANRAVHTGHLVVSR